MCSPPFPQVGKFCRIQLFQFNLIRIPFLTFPVRTLLILYFVHQNGYKYQIRQLFLLLLLNDREHLIFRYEVYIFKYKITLLPSIDIYIIIRASRLSHQRIFYTSMIDRIKIVVTRL